MLEIKSYKSYTEIQDYLTNFDIKSPFLNIEFHKALETSGSVGGNSGWVPFPIIVKQNGEPVGFMPIYLKEHSYGEYVFDSAWAEAYQRNGLNYYPKMILAIPFTPITGSRLVGSDPKIKKLMIEALENALIDHNISSCHILFPEEDESKLFSKRGWLRREGIQFKWINYSYSDFNDFLSNLSHQKRKKIKQERKKIEEGGLSIERKHSSEIKEEDIEFFYKCYCNTYKAHHSSPYLNKIFFTQLHNSMPSSLLLIIAKKNGDKVASALNIIGKDTLYGRYWGSTEYVPGLHFELCYYQGQEFCIEKNLKYFEGGAQGEHKLARGFEPFKTFSNHFIANKEFKVAINSFLNKESKMMHEYANELDDRTPYKK